MSINVLFLDDDKNRRNLFAKSVIGKDVNVNYAETSREAIAALDKYIFDIAFLDHDLGGKIFVKEVENTGYEVALHIESMPENKRPAHVVIHSFNPNGVQRMYKVLRKCVNKVDIIPFRDNFWK